MTALLTTDLLDANEALMQAEQLRVVTPMFQRYGGKGSFAGEIVTLKIFEDNSLVRTLLAEPGQGKVLVIDGGGSLRCALLGDQLAELAVNDVASFNALVETAKAALPDDVNAPKAS